MSVGGQQQTSKPFGFHVRFALNIGNQLLTVDTSALGQERLRAAVVDLSAPYVGLAEEAELGVWRPAPSCFLGVQELLR